MKKRLTLLLLLAAVMQLGWAQNTVESIRKRYADNKDYIATHQGDNANDGAEWGEYYHLEVSQFLPATGGHKEDVYMYFDEREEDKIYPSHYITFATKKYNFAAREYYEEYMFDSNGSVAFIYAYDPMWTPDENGADEQYEFRFYLNKGKLLKAIVKKRAEDNLPFTEVFSGATLKPAYSDVLEARKDTAEKIKQLFVTIEEDAYNYGE